MRFIRQHWPLHEHDGRYHSQILDILKSVCGGALTILLVMVNFSCLGWGAASYKQWHPPTLTDFVSSVSFHCSKTNPWSRPLRVDRRKKWSWEAYCLSASFIQHPGARTASGWKRRCSSSLWRGKPKALSEHPSSDWRLINVKSLSNLPVNNRAEKRSRRNKTNVTVERHTDRRYGPVECRPFFSNRDLGNKTRTTNVQI